MNRQFETKAVATDSGIDGSAIQQRAAEAAKAWVRELMKDPPGHRVQKAALLAKLSLGIARSMLGRMIEMEQRIASLEGDGVSKSIDEAAYDEMVAIGERLDRFESTLQEVADSGFRYRGYWQQGKSAKRGDAYTHNGSIWWALRDTQETPDRDSNDWHVAVRKGKDAK